MNAKQLNIVISVVGIIAIGLIIWGRYQLGDPQLNWLVGLFTN